jgi:hypothetical protein
LRGVNCASRLSPPIHRNEETRTNDE